MQPPLSSDTSPEAQQVLFELLRNAPAGKKIILTFDLIQTLRRLILADLRRRFPQASEDELRRRLITRLLPREDVIRAYGFDPKAEG
jgi:hypothetical protein